MKLYTKIQNGVLVPQEKGKFRDALSKNEGNWCEVDFGGRDRSIQQNKYYWGVIIRTIADDTGQDEDDIHDYLKTKFLRRKVNIEGEEAVVVGSTASLDTAEFEDYAEKCRVHAGEKFGLHIQLPNEDIGEGHTENNN